eukprot:365451-Chlamydomonas_euryale.AAC.4
MPEGMHSPLSMLHALPPVAAAGPPVSRACRSSHASCAPAAAGNGAALPAARTGRPDRCSK